MMKGYFIFFIFISTCSYSQEIVRLGNVSVDEKEILKHTWEASWITHPTASRLEYGVFIFREKFQIQNVPDSFIVNVSADNRYRLFVNGRNIAIGPARGDELNWRYETIDLAKYLNPGKNLVAAEVINFGNDRSLAQHSFQTAFLFQVQDSTFRKLNTGKGNWKVTQNKAYHPLFVSTKMVDGFYAAGPCDSVIAKYYPWGWEKKGFDDQSWVTPIIAFADKSKQVEAVGRGFIYGAGLHLVPRNIPMPQQIEERFSKIVRTDFQGKKSDSFISGKPTVISKNSKVSFLLDQSHLTIGYPEFLISKGRGSKIKITYAEAMRNSDGTKGNRNVTTNKNILGYYDVYCPDGSDSCLYTPLWLRTFRYVGIDIETGNEDLILNDYHNVFTAYPFVLRAKFNTDNPRLEQIWDVAWRTARLCASETYFDCPYYEQLQYIGDTRIQSLISLYTTGDDRLMKNAIKLFDDSRIPNGLSLSRYPSYYPQVIPTYSLMWVNMIYDYYMYRGDSAFIGQYAQGITGVLDWFEKKIDKTGMPGGLEWWNFTDYSPDFNIGIPDGADNGHSALVSLQYVYALQHAAELFEFLGQPYFVEKYTSIAEKIKKSVYESCYDKTRGLIAETPEKRNFSQHTSVFAILTNTIPEREQPALIRKILVEKDIIKLTIYFRFYLFRCLQKTGLGELYLDNLEPWYNMLDQGLTTFAETDINPRSDCHGWSASPLFDFLHTIVGIQPATPGFKTVLVEPNFGPLKLINAKFPHPMGDIFIHLEKRHDNGVIGYIKFPPNLDGIFRYKNVEIPLRNSVNINLK